MPAVPDGPDGALYASGGDGANFDLVDYGQIGNPLNPCGDPPGGKGATLTPPTAEGGALRSQDVRTTSDPTADVERALVAADDDPEFEAKRRDSYDCAQRDHGWERRAQAISDTLAAKLEDA